MAKQKNTADKNKSLESSIRTIPAPSAAPRTRHNILPHVLEKRFRTVFDDEINRTAAEVG